MNAMLFIVGWALIGACLTAFLFGRLRLSFEEQDWSIVLAAVSTILWPIVLVGMIVWYPANWIYKLSIPKK